MPGPDKSKILVVDDEVQIARVLKTTLAARGYTIRTAIDGDDALLVMKSWTPDLVITDLRMPNVNGVELCRIIRKNSGIPIIVLSVRNEERNKVEALDAGADDYVTKPFSRDELLARVRAALRRSSLQHQAESSLVEVGHFRIDTENHSVHLKGQEIRLTPKEFEVLCYLARHPDKVVTHRALIGSVWGDTSIGQTEYLRVFIGQLRKKIEPEDTSPKYITTEPWVGYRFNPEGA
ncbi:MAG TPA: response regulator transcription factor [Candidatus Sulfotelmatobacter sp.]|nr:response regulator transcription factor [Candidatus Sulfotelmatobacter sp.]